MNAATSEIAEASGAGRPSLITAGPAAQTDSLFGPLVSCPIGRLVPDPSQPRKTFAEDELKQLAVTIGTRGILAPLLARRGEVDSLIVVAGERRLRAALLAGLTEVPVRIANHSLDEADILELQLIENTTSQDVPVLELAQGLQRLNECRPRRLCDIAAVVGLHTSSVSRTLKLLTLPEPIRAMIERNELCSAVAGEIAKLKSKNDADKIALANKAARDHLSRDQVAAVVARCNAGQKTPKPAKGKPVSCVVFHLQQPAVQLTVMTGAGGEVTLETIIAALETVIRPARRLQQGAGELADLVKRFPKNRDAGHVSEVPASSPVSNASAASASSSRGAIFDSKEASRA